MKEQNVAFERGSVTFPDILLLIGIATVQLHDFAPLKPTGADWRIANLIRKEVIISDKKYWQIQKILEVIFFMLHKSYTFLCMRLTMFSSGLLSKWNLVHGKI